MWGGGRADHGARLLHHHRHAEADAHGSAKRTSLLFSYLLQNEAAREKSEEGFSTCDPHFLQSRQPAVRLLDF